MQKNTEIANVNGTASSSDPLWQMMAERMSGLVSPAVSEDDVKDIVSEAVEGAMAKFKANAPERLEVTCGEHKAEIAGAHHELKRIFKRISAGFTNLWLCGPAGTGKTTLGRQVAEALGLEFGFLSLSAGVTETHLMGRVLPQPDGSWAHQSTRFLDIYTNGGVFLLDEMDAADPNVMVSINAALANGKLANPITGEIHYRHVNCVLLAATNTWGTGASAQYVGRNPLDAATADRFVGAKFLVDYDRTLERKIASVLHEDDAEKLLAFVWKVRDRIASNRIQRVMSTRAVEAGVKLLAAEEPWAFVQEELLIEWTENEKAKLS